MMDHLLKLRTAIVGVLLVLLVVCGVSGGTLSGSNGTTADGTDTQVVDTGPQPGTLKLASQNSQIPSDSSTGKLLSAIVRDSNNNFLSGIKVTFESNSGGIQLENGGVTDALGRATARVDGTEASDSAVGILLVLSDDVANAAIRPPNQDSPFGPGYC
jgi:hypothetical protein